MAKRLKKIICTIVFCLSASLTFAQDQFPFLGEVGVETVNVRAGQNTNFEKLCRLNKGDQVVVVGKEFEWYKIYLPPQAKSYISSEFVQIDNGIGTITGKRVNIRGGAGPNFSILGQLEKDAKVKVLENQDGWCRIEPVFGTFGWVSNQFIVFKSAKIPEQFLNQPHVEEAPKVAEQAPPEPGGLIITVVGKIEGLDQEKQTGDVRHRLVVADETIYYLEGYKDILDHFVSAQVKIEGQLKSDPLSGGYPVITVSRVTLVL